MDWPSKEKQLAETMYTSEVGLSPIGPSILGKCYVRLIALHHLFITAS